MLEALDANREGGENRLTKTDLFTIYWPNLLVPAERWAQDLVGCGGEALPKPATDWSLSVYDDAVWHCGKVCLLVVQVGPCLLMMPFALRMMSTAIGATMWLKCALA